jgi:phospholipase/carboxylesterase
MDLRRWVLGGLCTIGAALACQTHKRQDTPSSSTQRPAPSATAPATHARSGAPKSPLEFVHIVLGGTSDELLPWVVGFHGLGDTPENFAHLFQHVEVRAHVYLPRAPRMYHAGFDWFGARVSDPAKLTDGIQAALPGVYELIERLAQDPANSGDAVVTGFSQGGILSFAIAAAGFPHVKLALPMAGTLPPSLAAKPTIALIAFHGESDTVVPFGDTKTLVQGWQNQPPATATLELHTYPTVQHTVSPGMHHDWATALQTALSAKH